MHVTASRRHVAFLTSRTHPFVLRFATGRPGASFSPPILALRQLDRCVHHRRAHVHRRVCVCAWAASLCEDAGLTTTTVTWPSQCVENKRDGERERQRRGTDGERDRERGEREREKDTQNTWVGKRHGGKGRSGEARAREREREKHVICARADREHLDRSSSLQRVVTSRVPVLSLPVLGSTRRRLANGLRSSTRNKGEKDTDASRTRFCPVRDTWWCVRRGEKRGDGDTSISGKGSPHPRSQTAD